jgi:hypothetical protein
MTMSLEEVGKKRHRITQKEEGFVEILAELYY